MNTDLNALYDRDKRVWDSCAADYEARIVLGHPDVMAYEELEEDFLDRLLLFLARDCGRDIQLYDVGCGSGRLHLRYGCQSTRIESLPADRQEQLARTRTLSRRFAHDPHLELHLRRIGGVDFSGEMLQLGEAKLREAGLGSLLGNRIQFDQGSAFELKPLGREPLPVIVSVCNSVGVMQGEQGAEALFRSMGRAAVESGGIALISGYRKSAVRDFALGNYESTMDVSGQPRWLAPDTYAGDGHRQLPRRYKRAHDTDPTMVVDVFDSDGASVAKGHRLERDPKRTAEAVASWHIRTHTDYESNWYSRAQFEGWMSAHWPPERSHYIPGSQLDALRGEPAQFALLDASAILKPALRRWLTPEVQGG